MRVAVLMVAIIAVGGCTTQTVGTTESTERDTTVRDAPVRESPVRESPVRESPVRESPVRDPPVRDTPQTEASGRRGAALALVDQAIVSIADGDLSRAAAQLERCLRIDGQAAECYYQLARVRAQEGRWQEARQFIDRALTLVTEGERLERALHELRASLEGK